MVALKAASSGDEWVVRWAEMLAVWMVVLMVVAWVALRVFGQVVVMVEHWVDG